MFHNILYNGVGVFNSTYLVTYWLLLTGTRYYHASLRSSRRHDSLHSFQVFVLSCVFVVKGSLDVLDAQYDQSNLVGVVTQMVISQAAACTKSQQSCSTSLVMRRVYAYKEKGSLIHRSLDCTVVNLQHFGEGQSFSLAHFCNESMCDMRDLNFPKDTSIRILHDSIERI